MHFGLYLLKIVQFPLQAKKDLDIPNFFKMYQTIWKWSEAVKVANGHPPRKGGHFIDFIVIDFKIGIFWKNYLQNCVPDQKVLEVWPPPKREAK